MAWVLVIGVVFWLSERAPHFREAGLMKGAAVLGGEWWRLFTAVFVP